MADATGVVAPALKSERAKLELTKANAMVLQMRFMKAKDFPENAAHGQTVTVTDAFIALLEQHSELKGIKSSTLTSWGKSFCAVGRRVYELGVDEQKENIVAVRMRQTFVSSNPARVSTSTSRLYVAKSRRKIMRACSP